MKRWLAGVVLSIGLAPTAIAGTAVIHISGYVPVICHADIQSLSAMPANEEIALGTIKEFCNAGAGYQLIANHSPGQGLGKLIIDGQAVPLDSSGQTVLARMPGPRDITQTLSYRPGTATITILSIEIRPSSI